jgi:predicted DNA-binding transcriptional regulator YafY
MNTIPTPPRKPERRHTLLRQWELLRLVPKSPNMASFKDIAEKLKEAGYPVDPNTVRRDLEELANLDLFPLVIDKEQKPHQCWWDKNAGLGLPVMDLPEALGFLLVKEYLAPLLPAELFKSIAGTFSRAGSTIEDLKAKEKRHKGNQYLNPSVFWLDKVRAIPPMQPMAPPGDASPKNYSLIAQALLQGKQVRASYRGAHDKDARELVLHPLGLILRAPVLYLVATTWHYQDVRLFALHRFTQVELLDQAVEPPPGFDLDEQIRLGLADFGQRIEPIEIELRVSQDLADYLEETPLTVRDSSQQSTQRMTDDGDGWYRLQAQVNDTWQLRWWILSQGEKVEVISPPGLRQEIASTVRQAAARYGREPQGPEHDMTALE